MLKTITKEQISTLVYDEMLLYFVKSDFKN